MTNNHPFIRYAKALVLAEYNLSNQEEITIEHIKDQIEIGLAHFRVVPSEIFEEKETVKYTYSKIEKGDTKNGIYLAPNSITTDMLAKNTWKAASNLLVTLSCDTATKIEKAPMSVMPLTGEYLSFSLKDGIGRGQPKITLKELGLCMISTLTPTKPCLQNKGENNCLIPDVELDDLIKFIKLFKDMLYHKSANDLNVGRVKKTISGKKSDERTTFQPLRPRLFNGNFPNPPKSPALGAVALLATIGEFSKEAEFSEQSLKVLDSLKNKPLYVIKYGNAHTFNINHFVIELAKSGFLREIIDSIYYTKLYNQPYRDYNNTEYQKFDLFSARFLQLFNPPSFKDFIAFRAEYPNKIEILFNSYFTKMEKIELEIVRSARQLGKWLNLVAYITAKAEIKESSQNYWEKLREQKAKVLIELESAAFSAKTGDALIAQVITRAGRLSGMDVPAEADLFMEKATSGELKLEQAQNLIIAFSRLKNAKENTDNNPLEETINEDLSNV